MVDLKDIWLIFGGEDSQLLSSVYIGIFSVRSSQLFVEKLCRTRVVYVSSCWKKINRPLGGAVTLLRSSVVLSVRNAGSAQGGERVFPVVYVKARGGS